MEGREFGDQESPWNEGPWIERDPMKAGFAASYLLNGSYNSYKSVFKQLRNLQHHIAYIDSKSKSLFCQGS